MMDPAECSETRQTAATSTNQSSERSKCPNTPHAHQGVTSLQAAPGSLAFPSLRGPGHHPPQLF